MLLGAGVFVAVVTGCTDRLTRQADVEVERLIEQRRRSSLITPAPRPLIERGGRALLPEESSYERTPEPVPADIPEGFVGTVSASAPEASSPTSAPLGGLAATSLPASVPAATQPARYRDEVLTLTDALAYAQQHRRQYITAKEDLYLAALALTLERHLWTPQFAAKLKAVYGNFGEITDFDQATRFVAELSVSQRLPLGGTFTAQAVSTLIRDVKRSITASEGSTITLGLDIPFLRNAGHVAQEDLIQLERSLVYAVRRFERFRRQQLVDVAQRYFSLLASKQAVLDAIVSVRAAERLYQRALDYQVRGLGNVLDTGRAETRLLSEQNRLAQQREAFRAATDRFKIEIGMPVDEPIGLDDLETIQAIEEQIAAGRYPLLLFPPAANDEQQAVAVAKRYRLDLLNLSNEIDDAKRGVAIARNALLPDLDWSSTLTFDTDPDHAKLGAFEFARATWRTEVILEMTDRFRERNRYRASLIDVRRARRSYTDLFERIVAEVRSSVHQIQLQEETLRIQRRSLLVAADRRDNAEFLFNKGKVDNRDLVEAQDEFVAAQNRLNLAKTDRWTALLEFRLATGTLWIDDRGTQHVAPGTGGRGEKKARPRSY